MDSDLSSTTSSFTEDPSESPAAFESWTSAGVSSYTSAMTGTKEHDLNSTDATHSTKWNSTFTQYTDDSSNTTSPTEAMVTTGDEFKKRRSSNSFQFPESQIVSQCKESHCYCSNLSSTNLEYNIQHGEIALLGFFPIHGTRQDGRFCSEFNRKQGFEPLMAFKYAVERVNADTKILGNIKLG